MGRNVHQLRRPGRSAIEATGRWATTLPQHFSDNDYYRRLHLADYEIIQADPSVIHHNISSMICFYNNTVTFPLFRRYYELKWGGGPDKEAFATQFNLPLTEEREQTSARKE
jgi:hypothetical protein